MSSIASQLSAGIDQAMTLYGIDGLYTRSDTKVSLPIRVIISVPNYQVAESDMVILAQEMREALVIAADLKFGNESYEPARGDTIQVSGNGQTYTYQVLVESPKQNCWTWADRYHIRRKIFVKLADAR